MNPNYIEYTPGSKVERWTILEYLGSDEARHTIYRCLCKCGTERVVQARWLKNGKSRSCGCLRRKHGATSKNDPEYIIWLNIRQRCNNPNFRQYKDYGGRGINLCEEWNDYATFRAYIGQRPSPAYSLDRTDNSKGYEPGNVRWADRSMQARNARNNRIVTAYGHSHTIAEWSERLGIKARTIQMRLQRGYSDEQALSRAPLPNPRRKGRFHEETRTGLFVN